MAAKIYVDVISYVCCSSSEVSVFPNSRLISKKVTVVTEYVGLGISQFEVDFKGICQQLIIEAVRPLLYTFLHGSI